MAPALILKKGIIMSNEVKRFNTAMDVPGGWKQLTRKGSIDELQFAIDQLETSNILYSICDHTDGVVSIWVRQK